MLGSSQNHREHSSMRAQLTGGAITDVHRAAEHLPTDLPEDAEHPKRKRQLPIEGIGPSLR